MSYRDNKWLERERRVTAERSKKLADQGFFSVRANFIEEMIRQLDPASTTPPKPKPAPPPPVTWDDVVGQEKAKAALREAIELPIKHADVYKRYGRKPAKGVLLYGPPGNGKTLLARAAASAATSGNSMYPDGFISVKGPEMFNMYLGETERNIRKLFDRARAHKQATGHPSVIFLDEAESLLRARGRYGSFEGSVQAFLAEMDGLAESSAIVLIATNRPEDIDPAALRDGRVDRRVHVGGPDRSTAEKIFEKVLKPRPLFDPLEIIVKRATEALFSNRHALYRVHLEEGPPKTVALHHVTSCAQVVGIVERATSLAIQRAIVGDDGGIMAIDLESEVQNTFEESRAQIHMNELVDFCSNLKVEKVERILANERVSPVKLAS